MGIRDDFERDQRESSQVGGSGDPTDEPADDPEPDPAGGGATDGFTGSGSGGLNDDDDDSFGGVSDDRQADRRESRQTRPAPEPEPEPDARPSTGDGGGREPTPGVDPPADFDTEPSTLLGPEAPGNPTDSPVAIDRGDADPSQPDAIPDDPFVPDADAGGLDDRFGQLRGPEQGPVDDAVSLAEAEISREVPGTISTEKRNFVIRESGEVTLTEQGLREAGADLEETVGGLPTVVAEDIEAQTQRSERRASRAGAGASLGGIGPRPGFGGRRSADRASPAGSGASAGGVGPRPGFGGRAGASPTRGVVSEADAVPGGDTVLAAEADESVRERLTTGGLFAESDEQADPGIGNDPIGTDLAQILGAPATEEQLDESEETFLDEAPILPTQQELRRGGAGPLDPEDPSESPATEGVGERLLEGAAAPALSLFNLPANVQRGETLIEIGQNIVPTASRRPAETAETAAAVARNQAIETGDEIVSSPARSAGSLGFTVAASGAAGGRLPRAGDLGAEFDPRVGPFGTTLETRAVRGARDFLSDDRGQLDLGGPRSRGDGSDGGTGAVDDALDRFEEAQRGTFERRGGDPLAPDEGRIGRDRGGPSDRFDPDSAGLPETPETDLRDLVDVERRLGPEVDAGRRDLFGELAGARLAAQPLSETEAAQQPAVLAEERVLTDGATDTDLAPRVDSDGLLGRDVADRADADARLDLDQRTDLDSRLDLDQRLDLDARQDLDARRDLDQRTDLDSRADSDARRDADTRVDADVRRDLDVDDERRRDDDDEQRRQDPFGIFGEQFENPVAGVGEFLGDAFGGGGGRG
jgi:hypothetical protein